MDSLLLLEAAPSLHRSYPTGRRAPADTLGVPWGCARTSLGGYEGGINGTSRGSSCREAGTRFDSRSDGRRARASRAGLASLVVTLPVRRSGRRGWLGKLLPFDRELQEPSDHKPPSQ